MIMSLSNDVEQWRSELHLRLKNFKRDIFFELTRTLNREWWASQIENWEVCEERIDSLLGATVQVDHGCLVLGSSRSRRVSVSGRQIYAYQYIYWAGNALLPNEEDVVRHACHNRRCINPLHLTHGTQSENLNDSRDR